MRRLLLVSVTVSLAVSALLVSLFAFSENSLQAVRHRRYLYPRGYCWPQRAFARGRHQTKRLSARRCGGDGMTVAPGQEYCERGAVAHRHPYRPRHAGFARLTNGKTGPASRS